MSDFGNLKRCFAISIAFARSLASASSVSISKPCVAYTEELEEISSFDTIIDERKKSIDELTAKEAGLAAKIADVDAACAATVAEAEARNPALADLLALPPSRRVLYGGNTSAAGRPRSALFS